MTTGPSRQRGLSLLGWIAVLIVVVVFGTAAFRMVPAYMEYNTIRSAITSVLDEQESRLMSPVAVRSAISKRFLINQVNVIASDDLSITRDDGQLQVGLDYEVREPLFYNVSVVMHFEHSFERNIGQ